VPVNKKQIITEAKPHTIRKFELIEKYIKSWAQKLIHNPKCNGLIFIDCMCNSGVYKDQYGNIVYGTPVRVSNALLEVARTYKDKHVFVYLNDLNSARVEELQKHLPEDERNFKIVTSCEDATELLEKIGPQLNDSSHYHYFLLYDPYDANIEWHALLPFFKHWGEVMINHALLDPIRAITSAKNSMAKKKYEHTYLEEFENLLPYGSNKDAYEKRVNEIINYLKGNRTYYVASFPFYNSKNSLLYDLIHCTSNIEGFKLYKNCAWKVFKGHSSAKSGHGNNEQLEMNFSNGDVEITMPTDETCYGINDIAKYLQNSFAGRNKVPINEIWSALDYHPIFPSGVYHKEIKKELCSYFGAKTEMIIDPNTGERHQVISFKG
jgi:three-Cys-motif partner protein